jgi:hypothetical protein
MQLVFEAKYLAIKWFDKNIVSKITEAISPIKEIDVIDDFTYSMEIKAYKRIENGFDGQVAFHILDSSNETQPHFINANGDKINLSKIIDPDTKKEWWIENGSWKTKKNNGEKETYRSSDLWNHAGETIIYFGNISCHISVSATSFTKEQLELYLEDFKNDFWYLILKKNSLTQASAKNSTEEIKILNKETVESIKKFIKHIQDILKNPKKELKEIQGLKDLKQVKPVAKTFMEIATGGMKRKLTSRDTVESYNVAENKYIHYALYQVYIIVLNMTKASQYINNIYQSKAKYEQSRVSNFKDRIVIDKEIIENKITNLKEKINKIENALKNVEQIQHINIKEQCEQEANKPTLQDFINRTLQNQNIQRRNENDLETIYIQLGHRKDYEEKMQFQGTLKLNESDKWHTFSNYNSYSLEFDKNIFNELLQENTEYKVTANVNKNQRNWTTYNRQGTIFKRYFEYIYELQPLHIEKPTITVKHQMLYIKLQKKQGNFENKIQFWGKVKLENSQEWHEFKKGDSISLEFDFNIYNHILQENTEYKVSAYIQESEFSKKNEGVIYKKYFKYITKIEQVSNFFLNDELNYYLKQKKQLELTDWIRPLNKKERAEQEKEKEAIKKQIQLLNEELQTTNEYIRQLEPLIQTLKNILNQFSKLFIEKNSYFPNSMTFIQNPHYQGGYKYYELIKNIIGIDESLFLSIQKVDKIGILDIPTLYERWCFLQIIKVLIDRYHFLPEENWKQKLLLQMLSDTGEAKENIRNIYIEFKNLEIERKIKFYYEKELDGKGSKRPDYFLEILSLKTNKRHNLIMDAKFKEDVNIRNLIDELYNKKNYSQNNTNAVFILHPDIKNSITQINPSDWGSDAYYGEIDMFDFKWDKDEHPNHKYGSILLSPIRGKSNYGNYLDSLQRLIGMSLQYQLEDNEKDDITIGNLEKKQDVIDPISKEKVFCLKCGSNRIKTIHSGFSRSQKGIFYESQCQECSHHFIYFYCWSCKYRLIKNGSYWSYHTFQPLEPFDIQCPHCAKFWHQNEGYEESKVKQMSKQNNDKCKITVFEKYDEASRYAKEHSNSILTRNSDGINWIVKE